MAAKKSKKAVEAETQPAVESKHEEVPDVAVIPIPEAEADVVELESEVVGETKPEPVVATEVIEPVQVPAVQPRDVGSWKPKTGLGKDVASGSVRNIDDVLKEGKKVMEPQIVDFLVPGLKSELIQIGGRKGKGGGKERIPVKITATMHRSGRRFTYNAFAIVGDEAGLIGVGRGSAIETRNAINKAVDRAKMGIIRIKRGCGSWECGCGGDHSIPYKTTGKSGSVSVVLMPAPKGLGLAADDESKKILKMAGIRDVWMKTYGNTGMRINLVNAVFDALKKLYAYER